MLFLLLLATASLNVTAVPFLLLLCFGVTAAGSSREVSSSFSCVDSSSIFSLTLDKGSTSLTLGSSLPLDSSYSLIPLLLLLLLG